METQPWLEGLNAQQREAVTHGDGPLLVVAGAGTGKTRTLTRRVAELLARGVAPERLLLLTFTRRAAEEMLRRATQMAHASPARGRIWGGTFHAVANRLLRTHSQAAGLTPDFTILDRADSEDLLDVIRTDLDLASTTARFPRKATCLAIYSRRVNGGDDLPLVLKRYFPWCQAWEAELRTLFRAYARRKSEHNLLDYDDLLLYWFHLLQDDEMAEVLGGGFDHILVDEYQDTNPTQAGILVGMRRALPSVTAVGDDAQSIYGFRAADPRNMLDFPLRFPGTRVVLLEENYRSSPPILETGNGVIAQARERYTKELWTARKGGRAPELIGCVDEAQQTEAVVRMVLEHYEQGIPLHRQAVLFRAASLSNALEVELARRNIPFHKYGGLRFVEAAHVKDLVALLRLAENPRDQVAWFRVLQLLEGVGPATAAAAFRRVAEAGYDPRALPGPGAGGKSSGELEALGALVAGLRNEPELPAGARVERALEFYTPVLERTYEAAAARLRDLEQLQEMAGAYPNLGAFLADLILDPPASTADLAGPPSKDEDWLVLSTIHSAKGLEWDVVYLIHAADGCLPSDMATASAEEIEEELRLTYVAVTRARDFLYVLWPLRYYHRSAGMSDAHSYAQLSRFFSPDVQRTMVVRAEATAGRAPDGAAGGRPRDIAARIRGMWD